MKETDLLEPTSYYAVSKCTQTHLCFNMAKNFNKPIVTLRPFSVYGPYEEPSRFVPTLLKNLYLKEKISLTSPDTVRDFIYIEDMIKAYLKIDELTKNPGKCFNIGTGIQSSLKQVVEQAFKTTSRKVDLDWGKEKPRSWDTTHWVADISRAKKLLKWKPEHSLSQGLYKNWQWFKKNRDLYI
jgi:nucleoside-diphosphate-sugar epimerase